MHIKIFKLIVFVVLCVSNFAIADVSYRKAKLDNFIEFAGEGDFGFIDAKLGDDRWKIKYIGVESSDYSELKILLERRASELCLSGFKIISYTESGSVVAHRNPTTNKFVEAEVLCV